MERITVEVLVNAPREIVWALFTDPKHITQWNNASPDWHTPRAVNDLREGGLFSSRMESLDGKEGFDFSGMYTKILPYEHIAYTMDGDDARKVQVQLMREGDATRIIETFDAEYENTIEAQRGGWQAILDNFKKYAERQSRGLGTA